MSIWANVLVQLATDPKISRARYGFHANRRGGAQYKDPQSPGFHWPMSSYINCCTWVAQALQLGRRMVGQPGPMTLADWNLAMMLAGSDRRGCSLMAHQMGLADEPVAGSDIVTLPGRVWVCQGWRASGGGHSFFLVAVNEGDHWLVLEANGQPSGGAVFGSLDGVGSRCAPKASRSARSWSPGSWPLGTKPLTHSDLTSTYTELWAAQLRETA